MRKVVGTTPVRAFSSTHLGETKKMNLFTAVNDAMRVAMQTDPTAIVFGEGIFVFYSLESFTKDLLNIVRN